MIRLRWSGRAWGAGVVCVASVAASAAADPPVDCFGCCGCPGSPPWQENCGWPQWRGGFPDGIPDEQQCVGDWARGGGVNGNDAAAFVVTWFYAANNPPNLDADIDGDGVITPADVALFFQYWYAGVHGGGGCP